MPQNVTNALATLQEFYDAKSPRTQILTATEFLEQFDETTTMWNGSSFVILSYVARDATGHGCIADGGAYPVAGNETDVRHIVTSFTVAGTVQITRKLLNLAKDGKGHTFVHQTSKLIERKLNTIKDYRDLLAIYGGRFKGLINEHKIGNTANGSFVGGGLPFDNGTIWFEYSGDFTPFLNVAVANTNTWVRIRLYRGDTLAEITPVLGVPGNPTAGIFVKDFNQTTCMLALSAVGNNNSTFTTAGVANGFAIALALHDTQLQDAALANFGTTVAYALEPTGLFGNLCEPLHFGVDRTTATGFAVLQSHLMTMTEVAPCARAALTSARLTGVRARVYNAIKKEPNFIVMNALQLPSYIALTVATTVFNTQEKGNVDVVPSEKSVRIAGETIIRSSHAPRGLIFMLVKDTWEYCPVNKGGWITDGGGMFQRVPGFSALRAEWEADYNLFCAHPQANAVLTGITI